MHETETDRREYEALPRLRAACDAEHARSVAQLSERLAGAKGALTRAACAAKLAKVSALPPWAFRSYVVNSSASTPKVTIACAARAAGRIFRYL